jgi:hypothetical protein
MSDEDLYVDVDIEEEETQIVATSRSLGNRIADSIRSPSFVSFTSKALAPSRSSISKEGILKRVPSVPVIENKFQMKRDMQYDVRLHYNHTVHAIIRYSYMSAVLSSFW